MDDVLQLLLTNVRTAARRAATLMAQIAANETGLRRIVELIDDWGAEHFRAACTGLIGYAERRTRAALAELPDGRARFVDYLEHTGNERRDIPIIATITKRADTVLVDLTETAAQVAGAINCSYAIAESCAAYVVKALTDPTLPSNAGLMRPITVLSRPGSLVHAEFPAAVANGNTQTAQRIVDVLLGAFEQIIPNRVPAASSAA